jgi:hypothetical protein
MKLIFPHSKFKSLLDLKHNANHILIIGYQRILKSLLPSVEISVQLFETNT